MEFKTGQLAATRVVLDENNLSTEGSGHVGRILSIADGVATLKDTLNAEFTASLDTLIPAVHYDVRKPFQGKLGERGTVTAVDHYNTSIPADSEVLTTEIQFIGGNGMFSTKNTMYLPNGIDLFGIGMYVKSPYLAKGEEIEFLDVPLEA